VDLGGKFAAAPYRCDDLIGVMAVLYAQKMYGQLPSYMPSEHLGSICVDCFFGAHGGYYSWCRTSKVRTLYLVSTNPVTAYCTIRRRSVLS
jgi:hypothetical protein